VWPGTPQYVAVQLPSSLRDAIGTRNRDHSTQRQADAIGDDKTPLSLFPVAPIWTLPSTTR
jgi:hypothetical protein